MIRMIQAGLFVLVAAVVAVWTTFTHANAQTGTGSPLGRIELEQTKFEVKSWRMDGSHLTAIHGRLTYGERPVAHALLQANANGRTIRTLDDGTFELTIDRSLIAYKPVSVVSVQEATIAGKPIDKKQASSLLSASSAISVYHPIEVTKVETSDRDPSKVKVHARFKIDSGDKISFFQVDKYQIGGIVADAEGNPVRDAIVWIDRDEGEGFAKSTPTDRNGRYEMYYWPEEEETNLTVIVGSKPYTLPEGRVFILPRNTSVDIRIRLPRNGSVIDDKPPTLVCTTSKGAKYAGLLAGLDVPPGTSYSVSVPDPQGRFVVTVPKDAWEKHPLFFETRMTKFIGQEKILKAGDELPVGIVQAGKQDPKLAASAPYVTLK